MTFIKVLGIPSSKATAHLPNLRRKDQMYVYLHEHFGNCHQPVDAISKSSAANTATT